VWVDFYCILDLTTMGFSFLRYCVELLSESSVFVCSVVGLCLVGYFGRILNTHISRLLDLIAKFSRRKLEATASLSSGEIKVKFDEPKETAEVLPTAFLENESFAVISRGTAEHEENIRLLDATKLMRLTEVFIQSFDVVNQSKKSRRKLDKNIRDLVRANSTVLSQVSKRMTEYTLTPENKDDVVNAISLAISQYCTETAYADFRNKVHQVISNGLLAKEDHEEGIQMLSATGGYVFVVCFIMKVRRVAKRYIFSIQETQGKYASFVIKASIPALLKVMEDLKDGEVGDALLDLEDPVHQHQVAN
jgi:hypothetical protein